jgi:hypothetical protein
MRNSPMPSLKTLGSACAISMVPTGTPARPPTMNGQTSLKSNDRHIVGSVEVWATTEQIRISGTASDGGNT